ncbi:MAG TPA: hypothetical protein VK153_03265 [Candidatus Paceibacterota bacterium]|nr:hypothetical protein [Candidatus Paceibacterota bacterium]
MENTHYFQSPVIASSGLMGIVGEGYKYHKIFRILFPFLFSFKWITFQIKTITSNKREGNMRLWCADGITPIDFHPKCIYANFWKGYGVNNVSLSNPGIYTILNMGVLQKIEGELHLSIMLVEKELKKRIDEIVYIIAALSPELKNFRASKIFLHYNVSCPNTGDKLFLDGLKNECNLLKLLKLPLFLKVGWDFPVEVILHLQQCKMIDGVDAINTIPFNDLPYFTKEKYFKKDKEGNFISPLDKYQYLFNVKGRGGVSGSPIRPYALRWIRKARRKGITLPIIGGGGILWPWHVYQFKKFGATAVSPGSVVFLRPWNLLLITLTALLIFRKH